MVEIRKFGSEKRTARLRTVIKSGDESFRSDWEKGSQRSKRTDVSDPSDNAHVIAGLCSNQVCLTT